jgi:heat shock protein HslJ
MTPGRAQASALSVRGRAHDGRSSSGRARVAAGPGGSRLGLLLAIGALSALLWAPAVAQAPSTVAGRDLDGTAWSLAAIKGAGSVPMAIEDGATLVFVGDVAGGMAGCNQYATTYDADGSSLGLGPVMVSRNACDEAQMALESAYLSALSSVAGYTLAGETLALTDATGAGVLGFYAAPMPSLLGTWLVTRFGDDGTTTAPSVGTSLTLAFSADGRIGGDGGCNRFAGPYGLSEDQVVIGPLLSTTRTCGEVVDSQEQRYLEVLQQAVTWAIASDSLELRGYDGTLLVQASRATAH